MQDGAILSVVIRPLLITGYNTLLTAFISTFVTRENELDADFLFEYIGCTDMYINLQSDPRHFFATSSLAPKLTSAPGIFSLLGFALPKGIRLAGAVFNYERRSDYENNYGSL